MNWLTELIDEFSTPTRQPKQSRIERMMRLWKDTPAKVMDSAVDSYILNAKHAFFPAISELRPFVDAAMSEYVSGPQKRTEAGDGEIYEWELARGTMRPLGEVDKEIAAARITVRELIAA